jgi:hypothetical protein
MEENVAVERGCGVREPGGIYIETRRVVGGKPPEHFVLDPPVPVPAQLDLPNRGVAIYGREASDGEEVFDVYDRVGETSYPNVADFIEETRMHGLSRRVPGKIDLSRLSDRSTIRLAHPRALITNVAALYKELAQEVSDYINHPQWQCRCHKENHKSRAWLFVNGETCASCWWELITGGEEDFDPMHFPRTVERTIGSVSYYGRKKPTDFTPQYEDAFFMRLPVHRIVVINDPELGKHEAALERLENVKIPVSLEDA